MAKRRSATPTSRPRAGDARRASPGRGARATTDVKMRSTGPTGAQQSSGPPTGPSPMRASIPRPSPGGTPAATGRGTGPRPDGRDQFEDVTAEVQRRRDLEEEDVPTPPSALDLDQHASAARSGHDEMIQRRKRQTADSATLTGGDVDADWESAGTVGEEAPGGENPTPDQDRVDDIGRAVGVDYEDNEELKSAEKIERRDKKRWELDPASSEDYRERTKRQK